jgi:hypothetical protein
MAQGAESRQRHSVSMVGRGTSTPALAGAHFGGITVFAR